LYHCIFNSIINSFYYSTGYHGQLGRKFVRGAKKYSTIPQLVELNVVIRQVNCGGLHTAALTESGQVFTWYVTSSTK